MDVTYHARRIADMAGSMRLARELIGHDHWSAEELAAFQRQRLQEAVRHATASSRFYHERYAGLDPGDPIELERLPVVDKATAPAYAVHGKAFFFSSDDTRKTFAKNPSRYIQGG